MKDSTELVKPKLSLAEKKIINLVLDALPSENSRRAYQRALEEFFVWHQEQNRPLAWLASKYPLGLTAARLTEISPEHLEELKTFANR